MTVKDLFCGLAHAGGKALNGIGAAATAVLRHADFQDDTSERCSEETDSYYRNSPNGDGRYGPRAYLKPHDTHDVHS
ncbi:hypothetical protein [Haliea sp.]|jgi:hypothetical protein|uniref:hypothetical protein n=1 Tax=Haliea sp. TaxID=1932666 RepID=UPI00257B038F|nr:hypothetical protein [Haliea sp.]|tara:strand:- start:4656 stop:4886 length:231 start_codon:yes stop_codon:yes gene_type:complete